MKVSKRSSLVLIAILIGVFLTTIYFFNGLFKPSDKPKAAIVDGLVSYPNKTFVEEATKILGDSGFAVDYIDGDKVTVDFYRRLPNLGYSVVVLRVHCGPLFRQLPDGSEIPEGSVLFTTETYSPSEYVTYQVNGQVAVASITGMPEKQYFAVPTWFLDDCAEGKFCNSTIVLDSCYGFYVEAPLMMAQSFIHRGAKVFVGWDGEVQPEHTDSAILVFLRAFCIDRLSIEDAVKRAMNDVGPDPFFDSKMHFYPFDLGDFKLDLRR